MLQRLVANLSGSIRHAKSDGREYLVAPVVIMTEGVHAGSDGPLFYPGTELEKSAPTWNDVPIVVYHPMVNGEYTTADDTEVLEKQGVGFLKNTRWKNGKLLSDAWIDSERAGSIDKRVLNALAHGMVMEVSTGLFSEQDELPGEWKGISFNSTVTNYRPDHLALLPDQRGACSVAAGCGLLQLNHAVPIAVANRLTRVMDEMTANSWDESYDDIRRQLDGELRAKDQGNQLSSYFGSPTPTSPLWIQDVYNDFFVYDKDGQLYKQDYSKSGVGKVEISGDPVAVVKSSVYRDLNGVIVNTENAFCPTGPSDEIKKMIKNQNPLVEMLANGEFDLTDNAFCPTGKGNGKDNSCSSHDGGGGSGGTGSSNEVNLSTAARNATKEASDAEGRVRGLFKGSSEANRYARMAEAQANKGNSALALRYHERAAGVHESMAAHLANNHGGPQARNAEDAHRKAAEAHEEAAVEHEMTRDMERHDRKGTHNAQQELVSMLANSEFDLTPKLSLVVNCEGDSLCTKCSEANASQTTNKDQDMDRTKVIANLQASGVWNEEGDTAILNGFSDSQLAAVAKNYATLIDNSDDEDDDVTENKKKGMKKTCNAEIPKASSGNPGAVKKAMNDVEEDDDESDNGGYVTTPGKHSRLSKGGKAPQNSTKNSASDEGEESPTTNAKPMSEAEYLATLPPRMQRMVTNALHFEEQQKTQFIDRILANSSEFTKEELLSCNGEWLQRMANLVKPTANAAMDDDLPPYAQGASFFGAAGAPFVRNSSQGEVDSVPLESPTLNFSQAG